jgi:hypothetical protein
MNPYLPIEKYTFGTGDRFAHQAAAQLKALQKAQEKGLNLGIVWNKSNREHKTIGSEPSQVRQAGDQAVKATGWSGAYYFDADHITFETVDRFIPHCTFFTMDVADLIGKRASDQEIQKFLVSASKYIEQPISIPGLPEPLVITKAQAENAAAQFLAAAQSAGKLYQKIASQKEPASFVTEVSMDEVDTPQGPGDLVLILLALAQQEIPLQTIAPRFSGRFNKGVDYVGDVDQFRKEFEADLLVAAWAAKEFGLPQTLKLSVHSGSDKFRIYPVIGELLKKHNLGIHVKTAGTTWLEEIIGLAEAGGTGLQVAKDVYSQCLSRIDELAGPYASVIDIDPAKLPSADLVQSWDSKTFARSVRHDQSDSLYNPSMRQLMHVGYKVAAEMGPRFLSALEEHEEVIGAQVTENLWDRHIRRMFGV